MTLRSRLAWTYGIAVFVAVMILAVVSLTAIDRSLRSSLDSRLTTAAFAARGLVDVHHGRIGVDPDDEGQLLNVLPNDMQVAVFGRDGTVFFTTATSRVPAAVRNLDRWNDHALSISSGGAGDKKLRIAVAPVIRGTTTYGAVVVWEGSDYIGDFDRNAIIAMGFAALLIAGIVVMLSSTLARRALAPLEDLTELATEIEAHDLSRRIGRRESDELGRLASAFDRMLDRLQAAFARQRQFTADASHELRAPLAVMRAEADVALERERTPQEYRATLETIVQEVDRIDGLVDLLLLAARADSARLRIETIDVTELVLLTVERFMPAASASNVTLETSTQGVVTEGDAQALERALSAVLHNAIEFAATVVRVRVYHEGEDALIRVDDDGPGFSPEGLTHATERFWRADPARRRGGTGLGLSIADAIARALGGRLVLANAEPHGAIVEIHIPFIAASSINGRMGA